MYMQRHNAMLFFSPSFATCPNLLWPKLFCLNQWKTYVEIKTGICWTTEEQICQCVIIIHLFIYFLLLIKKTVQTAALNVKLGKIELCISSNDMLWRQSSLNNMRWHSHTESKGKKSQMQLKHTERKNYVFKSNGNFHGNHNITLAFRLTAQC